MGVPGLEGVEASGLGGRTSGSSVRLCRRPNKRSDRNKQRISFSAPHPKLRRRDAQASRLSAALRHAWQTQALRNRQLGGHHVKTFAKAVCPSASNSHHGE
eukprot:Skav231573  [mRNA]  locus=scaffold481:220076:222291:+ [translate_table: standard]